MWARDPHRVTRAIRRRCVMLLRVTAAVAVCGTSGAAATSAGAATVTSSNWGGYAVTRSGLAFRRVSSTWVVSRGTCSRGSAGYSATWIGLGGFNGSSQALEQIGTELDCSVAGRAYYSTWYELVPQAPRTLALRVRPGDRVAASVEVIGTRVSLGLRNRTTGASFSRTTRMSSPDASSAEWIVEAPSACESADRCVQLPLSNFGTTSFRNASATSARGHTGTISDRSWSRTRLNLTGLPSGFIDAASTSGASPSALSSAGSAFSITYKPAGAAARNPSRRVFPGAGRLT